MQRATESRFTVLIGDIAGSRDFTNQELLFRELSQDFDWINRRLPAEQPLQFTIGDEFQAAYRSVAAAVRATILLKLRFKQADLRPSAREQELRIGLACGDISVYDRDRAPFGQSGDAWWNARQAIERAEQPKSRRGVPYAAATRFYAEDPLLSAMANGCLLALDQVLYRMDRRDLAITLGLLTGRTQQEIAGELGVSQPVVSRRSKTNGAYVIGRILEEFEQVGAP